MLKDLRVHGEVRYRGQFVQKGLDVAMNSSLDVPVKTVRFWVRVQEAECDFIT